MQDVLSTCSFVPSGLLAPSSPVQALLEPQVTGNLAAPRGHPQALEELKAGSRREVVWREMFVGDEHTAMLREPCGSWSWQPSDCPACFG